MISRHSPALLTALACGALLAGCGSSSSSSSTTGTAGSTNSPATTGAAKVSAAAVEKCKSEVKVLPTLPQKTKSRLESICAKAASGDETAARTAAREGCEEIVKASPLPAGTARDHALAGCKSAEKK
jgi:ABC-type glycerol-3-phosphate transport system substrate-binding protein